VCVYIHIYIYVYTHTVTPVKPVCMYIYITRARAHARAHARASVSQGVHDNISGFNSRADSESQLAYTRGYNSQQFRSYEFLNYSKLIRKERQYCAFIEICC